MAEKETDIELERIYVVPLRRTKLGSRSQFAPRAVKQVRRYLTKHMKVETDNVWIDDSLNHMLWSRGKFNIPSKIRIRAVKFEDGIVEATLPEISEKKSRREVLREEKEKKTPILRREEIEPAGEAIPGSEDYDISPTADGDVKIKKKKAPKTEEEKKESEKKKETPAKKVKEPEKKTAEEEKRPAAKPAEKKKTAPKKSAPKKSSAKKSSTKK